MTAGIYTITNTENGRYYLGSAQDIEERWAAHQRALNGQYHCNIFLQRAWNKYGAEKFQWETVLNLDDYTRDEIFEIEQSFLDNLNEKAYNLSKFAKGGDLISSHPDKEAIRAKITAGVIARYDAMTEEERARFSERSRGENNGMYGQTHTPEARKRMSEANLKYFSENESYRTGKTLEEIHGEEEAKRIRTIMSEIASTRTGEKNSFYGKKHSDETKTKMSEIRTGTYNGNQNLPITIDGVYYRSAGAASKALGINAMTIRWRVLSKNKKFDNYQYANE